MCTRENVKEVVKELREKYPNARLFFIHSTEKENHTTNEKFRSYYTKLNGVNYSVRFDRKFNCTKYDNMIVVINENDFDRGIINGYTTLVMYRAKETVQLEDYEINENSLKEKDVPKLEVKETPKFEEVSSDDDLPF